MIIKTINDNILESPDNNIAFAINKEGYNDSGFAGKIAYYYWPEIKHCGTHELGTVLSKTINDKTFHALVCHSLNNGWINQREIVKNCFDNIPTNEIISTVALGTGFEGFLSGADIKQILCGMYDSNKQLILYSSFTLDDVIKCYLEENSNSKSKALKLKAIN